MAANGRACLFLLCSILPLLIMTACGGSSQHTQASPPPQIAVSIAPENASALINGAVQFGVTVSGSSDTAVTWSLKESNGGTVTAAGLYQAPSVNGTYHVTATSVADPSKSATATVAISAQFAFIEEYPAGGAQPFSMTPFIWTFGADGKLVSTAINDSTSGKPLSLAMNDISLSLDGKKLLFTVMVQISQSVYLPDIFIANADGTNLKQLTSNLPQGAYMPQFTPDGSKIVYATIPSGGCCQQIWIMNADGSNPFAVYPTSGGPSSASYPSVTPDGTKIVAEVARFIGATAYYDGIAIMDLNGSNIMQLTGNVNTICPGDTGYDSTPSVTPDGKQIVFSRFCNLSGATIFSMNLDGSNVKPLVQSSTSAVINWDPYALGDMVVFTSNMDNPASSHGFELYMMKIDGSGLTRLTSNGLYDAFNTRWLN